MIPAIILPTIVRMVVFMMMKIMQCLQIMKYVDIGLLIKSTLLLAIADFIIVLTLLEVDISINRPATISPSIMKLVLTVEVELSLTRPATIPLKIMDQEFMLTGEVDTGRRTATLPPITQVALVDF